MPDVGAQALAGRALPGNARARRAAPDVRVVVQRGGRQHDLLRHARRPHRAVVGRPGTAGLPVLFKLPRTVTHDRRLRDCSHEVARFVRRLEPLGERATTLSVQLPQSFGPTDLGALAAFLRHLPGSHRYAVEVRHPRFFDGSPAARALERMLHEHGAEWISFDTTVLFSAPPRSEAERDGWAKKPRLPRRMTAIGDHPMVRYIGRDDVASTVDGWQPWLPVIAQWLKEGRTPTVFVHTPDNSDAPLLARRLHDQVRALVPALSPLPEPVRDEPTTLF